ncbi:MAG: hypothetical protein ACKVW3_16900 [Phycisphaerales bacterium]
MQHQGTDPYPSANAVINPSPLPRTAAPGLGSVAPVNSGTPGALALLTASGVAVGVAAYLGVHGLKTPVLGMPGGVWLLGLIQLAGHLRRRHELAVASTNAAPPKELLPRVAAEALDLPLVIGSTAAAALDVARSISTSAGLPSTGLSTVEQRAAHSIDRSAWPMRPLRIGLDLTPELFAALTEAPSTGGAATQWVRIPSGRDDDADLKRFHLDALVRQQGQGPVRVVSPEADGLDAAWFDWSAQRPLTYGSIFPLRVDAAQVNLGEIDPGSRDDLTLAACLVRAMATLSRSPARLTLADRLRGRRPVQRGDLRPGRAPTGPAESCLLELAGLITRPADRITDARRAAARVAGAWLASTDARLELDVRRRGVDAALDILGDEPEALLRAAALRLASGDDEAAFAAMVRADAVISRQNDGSVHDHLAFLQAEFEMGAPGPLTLGRVGAGIVLAAASSPPDRLTYVRSDIMDDIRYSSWLVGRDQDQALLVRLFSVLERARMAPPQSRAA